MTSSISVQVGVEERGRKVMTSSIYVQVGVEERGRKVMTSSISVQVGVEERGRIVMTSSISVQVGVEERAVPVPPEGASSLVLPSSLLAGVPASRVAMTVHHNDTMFQVTSPFPSFTPFFLP